MIEVEVAITPIGTGSTSTSDFIAESEKVLKKYPNLNHKLTAMATEIEGSDLNEVFEAIKEMHLSQFKKGAKRIDTTIVIDDRRDKNTNLSEMVESVFKKM
ncbi:MAG: hypothetical protein A2287_04045 [Candidatus Melainabacteria bacterium RIFOXYA12_FULL_32_12]|nr:MAG: hypothetical protein A2287_04045 [Candidatus Melainabacteria bacterium RIFOXYA12_FULL_32_12]